MSDKTVKIVLNAMVKNEAAVIERMLESTYKHIDYWVIQDNGSTDGTQDIIKNFFESKKIPGILYYEPWQYPGYNRNHTLQHCLQSNHGCDYVLRMDADEILEVDDNFDWNSIKNHDAWNVVARSGNYDYYRMWLWKASLPWYFADDKRHETIHMKDNAPYSVGMLSAGFRHVLLPGGVTWENPFKFFIDALELENQVVTKQNCKDLYHLFYVGKSYNDTVNTSTFPFKLDHAKEIVRRATFYFEQYIKSQFPNYPNINLYKSQPKAEYVYYGLYLIGNMNETVGNIDTALEYWKKAYTFDPIRNEAILRLCEHYLNRVDDIPNLYIYANIGVRNQYPFPDKRVVWVEKDAYADTGWKILDHFAVAAYHMGYYNESRDACELLLSEKYKTILPVEHTNRIAENLRYSILKLQ
jgi:glycosyltransferase involved in cell wall biosynthesis